MKIGAGWTYEKPLTGPDVVRDYARLCGVELPWWLVDFLVEHNAGRPPEREFETEDGRACVFKCLFSYDPHGYDTVYAAHDALVDAGVSPALYPIGCDPFGNIVCFDTDEHQYAFVDHETGDVDGIICSSNPELFPCHADEGRDGGEERKR